MILRDRVTISAEQLIGYDAHGNGIWDVVELGTFRAHVGSASGSSPSVGHGEVNITNLRCLVPPVPELEVPDISSVIVRWRGEDYRIENRLPISRGGRTHHLSMDLTRFT